MNGFAVKDLVLSRRLYLLFRLGLAAVFIWAGATKLMAPKAFARTIAAYGILPEAFLPVVAVGLSALEVLAGVGLLFDVRGSLKVIFVLLLLFVALLGFGIMNNMEIECGCFSPEEIRAQNGLKTAFYRDIGLLLVVSYLFLWKRSQRDLLRHRPE